MILREFRTLLPLIRRYRGAYAAGILSLLATAGAQLTIPQFVRRAVDLLIDSPSSLRPIVAVLLTMVGVAVVVAAGRWGWRYFIQGASRRVEAELREKLYQHLTTLPRAYFEEVKTGDLMALATNDLNAVRMALGMGLVAFFDGLFMSVAILAILLGWNARLALLTIVPLPLLTVGIILVGQHIGPLFRQVQEAFSTLTDQVQEVLSGVRVVKVLVKERYFVDRFSAANDRYQRRNLSLVRIWGFLFPAITFLSGLTLLLLILFGGRALITGIITTGEFVAALSYLQMLIWPVLGAGFTINLLQRGAASMGRINKVLSTLPTITSPPAGQTTPGQPEVVIQDLSFAYPQTPQPVLQNISFQLAAGEFLGILGATGSGKTTLAHTLLRIIDPPEKTIYVGGVDVRDYQLDTLRGMFAVVPQTGFLFSTTVLENLRFGRPNAPQEEIDRVLQLSALSGDIARFPHGIDTVVGEWGVTLSGGQQQRIAIARALLIDPPILLLDDALSAVDAQTGDKILTDLLAYRRGRTTIVVSNRVSTFASADLVLVLEGGRVTQRGTHQELIATTGFYRRIFDLQRLERAERLP